MKQIAALFLIGSLLLACASNPCDSDDALTKFAQENALKYFPVPASVNFTMDSVYGNDFGDRVIRGRVSYTNTLGGGIGPMKYWLAVSCASGYSCTQAFKRQVRDCWNSELVNCE